MKGSSELEFTFFVGSSCSRQSAPPLKVFCSRKMWMPSPTSMDKCVHKQVKPKTKICVFSRPNRGCKFQMITFLIEKEDESHVFVHDTLHTTKGGPLKALLLYRIQVQSQTKSKIERRIMFFPARIER